MRHRRARPAALLLAALAGAGCSEAPRGPLCGDGVIDEGEQCDDANVNEGDDCLPGCVVARCGDGVLRNNPDDVADLESCDDGGVDTVRCDADCTAPACGDGHRNVLLEVCDDGGTDDGDGCSADCRH